VDFTREPLVETIITPKEGYKLVIRATSGNNQEEYSVSAVEIVAFGNCFFFRSLEKPKAFLLPMTEYEVVEARETRTVLKKPHVEKSIKIGERKKTVPNAEKEKEEEEENPKEGPKKRERKRTRKRRPKGEKEEAAIEKIKEKGEEKKGAAPIRRTLLPPPTSLISEQIDRYKHYLAEHGALLPEEMESESKVEELKPETDESPSFPFGEEATPQTPTFSEETPLIDEDKVVDITEEAYVPPEDNES